jgi:hypothetical protein
MAIEERLARLERKNRRLTAALLSVGIAAVVAVGMGQGSAPVVPQEIRAHKFTLVGNNGELRASLMMLKDGPGLFLYDTNGGERAGLWLDKEDDPAFTLSDEKRQPRTKLSVDKLGPHVQLNNQHGQPQVSLLLLRNGPIMVLLDGNGRVLRSLSPLSRELPRVETNEDRQQLPRGTQYVPPGVRNRATPAPAVPDVIESRIDGDFEGWEGDTVVKLTNGQIWRQISPHIEIHIAVNPKVVIYRSGARYKMQVERTREPVEVERLR